MADKIKIADRKHPKYEDNEDKWELYYSAAKGGDDFVTDENLFSHRLEESDDYDERLQRAYFLNFCDTLPKMINSYIMKESIDRPPDEKLTYFRSNVDGQRLAITDLIKRSGYLSSVFGVVHILLTMPFKTSSPITKAQEKELKLTPKIRIVKPTELVDWSTDSNGDLNWIVVKYSYYRDEDITIKREEEEHFLVYTKEEWWIEDQDGNKIKLGDKEESSGKNPLGYIPLVTIYHNTMEDDKVGESLLKDIVYINRTILNWCSCIDEQIERQTFSQLVVPDDGSLSEKNEDEEDPLHQIGTSSVWTFSGDATHPPQFISPDVANIQTIWSLVIDHIKEIYRLARLIGSSEDMYASVSGRSKQMGFMSVNSALVEKASSYQKAENDISKIVYDYLGEDYSKYVPVKYPTTFDIAALQDELDSILKVMERNFSVRLNKTLQKKVAAKSLPTITDDIKSEIEQEIEDGDGIVESIKGGNSFDGTNDSDIEDDGNPNVNRLANTFTSKKQNEELVKGKKSKKKVFNKTE
jgi:hypothetical protein